MEVIAIMGSIGFVIGIVVLVLWIAGMNNKKIYDQYVMLADKFKLQLSATEPKPISLKPFLPSAMGNFGNSFLNIYSYRTGYGRNQQFWTAVKVSVNNPQDASIKIHKQGFFSKIGKAFGMQDIEIGDPDFDKNFILKSSDENLIKDLLRNPAVREQFFRVFNDHKANGTIRLEGNEFSYVELGLINADRTRTKIEMVAVLMKALSDQMGGGTSAGQAQSPDSFFQENQQ